MISYLFYIFCYLPLHIYVTAILISTFKIKQLVNKLFYLAVIITQISYSFLFILFKYL